MNKKMHLKPLAYKHRQSSMFRFTAVSPTMLFRTVILFGSLLVASIAILRGTNDSNVWAFLGSIVIYAALTNGQGNTSK